MCGIAGAFGQGWTQTQLEAMLAKLQHRGPDDHGVYISPDGQAGLGHRRLSIIDLSSAGHNPMSNGRGDLWLVFNGEIYNYVELKQELKDYPYRSNSDAEVILAAYEQWGQDCLDHFVGMFAFLLWSEKEQMLFAARDRFGVKPLYYHVRPDGQLLAASEIKALHAAGVDKGLDETSWATYFGTGLYDHSERTFWDGVRSLPGGCKLTWRDGLLSVVRWYDLAEKVKDTDNRPLAVVEEEYFELLKHSVKLRFRSDVPVGINISGGLDSSTLLGLVGEVQGQESDVKAFTYTTGDPNYDELSWVHMMLEKTRHPSVECRLTAEEVPALAGAVARIEDEPFGGVPTLAYAKLHRMARDMGVIVLLDGNGMDEQWAGYDYYTNAMIGKKAGTVQGTKEKAVRPECLMPDFRSRAVMTKPISTTADKVRDLQLRDICISKIPRALRFNDRASMRSSCELREPFLDHRLFELALRQPVDRKIKEDTHKWLLRRITARMLPHGIVEAPKRPVQTPQREWLRDPLREWAHDLIEIGLRQFDGKWFDGTQVRTAWKEFFSGQSDNSFYVWQWLSLGLVLEGMQA
jgi:asparagine synthase (glutamine-hydrolysing)